MQILIWYERQTDKDWQLCSRYNNIFLANCVTHIFLILSVIHLISHTRYLPSFQLQFSHLQQQLYMLHLYTQQHAARTSLHPQCCTQHTQQYSISWFYLCTHRTGLSLATNGVCGGWMQREGKEGKAMPYQQLHLSLDRNPTFMRAH